MTSQVAAIVIGRNEGDRLVRCLAALGADAKPVVYVDSGSTDDSVEVARQAGAQVIDLDLSTPFTAARARNAGLFALGADGPEFVQFIDGDCELDPGWIDSGRRFLEATPQAAIACGGLRERSPEASIYNRLCDAEWDTPIGCTRACGGIFLGRTEVLVGLGGFNPALIAGEEPELCVRLRAVGWEIWRLDVQMALHDAAMTRFSQWWRRAVRGGHASAEGAAMHGAAPERHGVAQVCRALIWAAAIPSAVVLLALFMTPWAWSGLLIYPFQITRLAARNGIKSQLSWVQASFTTVGKFAEALGILGYVRSRLLRRRATLIEYK